LQELVFYVSLLAVGASLPGELVFSLLVDALDASPFDAEDVFLA
jgi:hypothetical protein